MARAESRRRRRDGGSAPVPRQPAEHDRSATLILQRSAGNRAVQSLVAGRTAAGPLPGRTAVPIVARSLDTATRGDQAVGQRAAGPLTPAQEAAAVTFNRARYDANSVRVIQMIVATEVDGVFNRVCAQAVARFQNAWRIAATGKVDEPTLDAIVSCCVAMGNRDYAIYTVADFFTLATRRDTLTIRFDAAVKTPSTSRFEAGNLRVIRLGPTAMTGAARIRDAINAQLARPAPAFTPATLAADLLRPAKERAAVAANRARFKDRRSIQAIQGAVGASPDGRITGETVERIAAFQRARGLTVDGTVDRLTLAQLVTALDAQGAQNGAIRAIVDFYRMDESGLVRISFDSAEADNAEADNAGIGQMATTPGSSTINVGPKAFAQGFAGLVHTIAHEFEHVRQNREGIADLPISEFLGERVEILSRGMDEEALAGFMSDAQRALESWDLMPLAQRQAHFAKFVEVRERVRSRLAGATAAERLAHTATLVHYDAVVKP